MLKKSIENELCAMVGDHYGVEGECGKFLWFSKPGSVSYKSIAEELAGGKIPEDLFDRHRGAPTRMAQFYPAQVTRQK
jgi:hypothetical protein